LVSAQMDSPSSPEEHQSPYINASTEGGAPQPDSYHHADTLDPQRHVSTQDSPQFMYDCAIPPPFHEEPMHPVGTLAVGNNLLPPPLSREKIPQHHYKCGNTQKREQKQPIIFSKNGRPGVKLVDALDKRFEGVDDRDGCPFGEDCYGITIRIHFPGYLSNTEVERVLKISGRTRAKSMQVSTKDYRAERRPVNRERLVREVSKRINWHIEDLLKHGDLFPFDDRVGEKWRLGQGMKLEDMTVTGLDNVTHSSWSPVIWIDRDWDLGGDSISLLQPFHDVSPRA